MDKLTSNSLLMMEKSVNYLWAKQTAIADNITNAETPGYKAKYVTFEDALQQQLAQAQSGTGSAEQTRQVLNAAEPLVQEETAAARMDDNGVNVTEQIFELSRNAYQLQYVYKSINSDLSILRTAITG